MFSMAIIGKQAVNIERERHKRDERQMRISDGRERQDEEEEAKKNDRKKAWVSLPSNNLSLPAWPAHKEAANICGGRP